MAVCGEASRLLVTRTVGQSTTAVVGGGLARTRRVLWARGSADPGVSRVWVRSGGRDRCEADDPAFDAFWEDLLGLFPGQPGFCLVLGVVSSVLPPVHRGVVLVAASDPCFEVVVAHLWGEG